MNNITGTDLFVIVFIILFYNSIIYGERRVRFQTRRRVKYNERLR